MTQLTDHFSFEELTDTPHTSLLSANRQDAAQHMAAISALASLLELVRAKFGPVSVHVAYRNAALNAAVKGSPTSQHLKGEAADFHCPQATLLDVYRWIVTDSGLHYGQAILERRGPGDWQWIHLSLGEPWRPREACRQALYSTDGASYHPWQG